MKKGVFIIPYIGKFNNYFQLFLNSCKENEDWDWMIFTDDKTKYMYPENVIVHYTDFDSIKKLIQSKFDFKISLDKPHKICDFRPAYGYIFEKYLKEYEFWGHCDCDVIFGNINNFVTEDMLKKYEKIFCLGHCTLYKNTKECNMYFKDTLNGIQPYINAFSQPRAFTFDEDFLENNINWIWRENNHTLFEKDFSANISRRGTDLGIVKYDDKSHTFVREMEQKGVFIWNHGNIEQYYIEEGKLLHREFLYIHLQSRKMSINMDNLFVPVYKISANNFSNLEVSEITLENYQQIKWKYKNNQKKNIIRDDFKFWMKRIHQKIFKR